MVVLGEGGAFSYERGTPVQTIFNFGQVLRTRGLGSQQVRYLVSHQVFVIKTRRDWIECAEVCLSHLGAQAGITTLKERIVIELMTSDHKLKASIEGSK